MLLVDLEIDLILFSGTRSLVRGRISVLNWQNVKQQQKQQKQQRIRKLNRVSLQFKNLRVLRSQKEREEVVSLIPVVGLMTKEEEGLMTKEAEDPSIKEVEDPSNREEEAPLIGAVVRMTEGAETGVEAIKDMIREEVTKDHLVTGAAIKDLLIKEEAIKVNSRIGRVLSNLELVNH